VFVTEYGIADLRGKSDEDCVLAMLAITDARFQPELVARAQAAGKLRRDFQLPDAWRGNTPQRLHDALAAAKAQGLFPAFPFGSDFTPEELALLPALKRLQSVSASKTRLAAFLLGSIGQRAPSAEETRLLARLGLDRADGMRERVMRRLVLRALRR